MKIGIIGLFGGPSTTPEFVTNAGRTAEEFGFHSIWAWSTPMNET